MINCYQSQAYFFLLSSLSSIKRECNMSSLWQMRFSILCLTWYCFELTTGTKMYSIKNSEGGKMEKHKVSWFSFGEWCTSFLSVKKMFRCIFKIVTSFSPDISHILVWLWHIVSKSLKIVSQAKRATFFWYFFVWFSNIVLLGFSTFSIFRTASLGFLIRTILLVHIISEVYGCSFFSQSVISFWSYTRLVCIWDM